MRSQTEPFIGCLPRYPSSIFSSFHLRRRLTISNLAFCEWVVLAAIANSVVQWANSIALSR
ncbi:hypothetical protein I8752_35895 [Nostocaceae cyanobacterium CENA369]|uniref:Uncharacterized protein n=1 Tax=Dendronalium phyllosphericum CENA369 TaxID=1725256 RepID=A0A8J7I8U2_9NOST|nr:hypothetical protein [Dendronalium phyllosphericum]MBH8578236.1 hypothetical protein [Dendronalium phyllosphericum CENA369]